MKKTTYTKTEITKNYRLDQYGNVYDSQGNFYCKLAALTAEEKKIVKQNPFSAN